jgi:hypothetical protein
MSRTTNRRVTIGAERLEGRDLMSAITPMSHSGPAEVRHFNRIPEPWHQTALSSASDAATGEVVGPNDRVTYQALLSSASGTALGLSSRYRPTESI